MIPLSRRATLALALTLLTLAALLAGAASAGAGVYRAVQCHARSGAGHADLSFARNSRRYVAKSSCAGAGVGVTHDAGREPTRAGRHGTWALRAPAGTSIVRTALRVSGAWQGGHVPQLIVGLADGRTRRLAGVTGAIHPLAWSGAAARSLRARLTCVRPRCGAGRDAHVHARGIRVWLRDSAPPSVTLGGSLAEPGAHRGAETLVALAADRGGGVRSIAVDVNGEPLAARASGCALSAGFATRLAPCPAEREAVFDVATAPAPFRQGPNDLRVCVSDLAVDTAVNRACERRTVRIDNLCPVSGVHGAQLTARFAGGGERLRTAYGERARVIGRVTDAAGAPVVGAQVCVATRPLLDGVAEAVAARPYTDSFGRFDVLLPAGPSRAVRVAHWPGAERALERRLELRVRARPRLRLRPSRTLQNGERLRFAVRLPGPARRGRRVVVMARAGERWVNVASGRTNARGRWRGGYRFRSTTGRRTYAFRARVPRQRGYPYEPGFSAIRKATVVG